MNCKVLDNTTSSRTLERNSSSYFEFCIQHTTSAWWLKVYWYPDVCIKMRRVWDSKISPDLGCRSTQCLTHPQTLKRKSMSEQLSSGKFTNFVIFFLEKNEKNKLTLLAIKPGHGKSPINSSMMFPAIFNLQTSFRDFTDVLSICASKKPPGRRTTFPDHLWESCVSWAHRKWKQWRDPRCSPTLRCSTQRPRCCKLFSPGEKPKKSWSGEKSPQNFIQIWCVSTQNHWHFMNILNQFEPQLSPCSPHLPMFWSRPSADLPH